MSEVETSNFLDKNTIVFQLQAPKHPVTV